MKDLIAHSEDLIKDEFEIDQIERAKENPRYFEPLYKKYYVKIFRFLLKRHADIDTAEEICSTTFLKAITKLKQYKPKPHASFSSWLYKIALNESNGYFRASKKKNLVLLNEEITESLINEISSTYTKEDFQKLSNALQKISKKQLQLLQLRFYENLSFKQVGEILDITENNAKVRCYRILDKIRILIAAS